MVEDRCPICGLPKELCVCGEIKKEEQKITVRSERRKYRKEVTLIEGLNPGELDVKSLLKDMKSRLACGGTYKEKERTIILQGNHVKKVKQMLIRWGISPEKIELIG